jgi:hypothetical protein
MGSGHQDFDFGFACKTLRNCYKTVQDIRSDKRDRQLPKSKGLSVYSAASRMEFQLLALSQELLWLWYEDSLRTQERERPPLKAGIRGLVNDSRPRRLSASCSELLSVRNRVRLWIQINNCECPIIQLLIQSPTSLYSYTLPLGRENTVVRKLHLFHKYYFYHVNLKCKCGF